MKKYTPLVTILGVWLILTTYSAASAATLRQFKSKIDKLIASSGLNHDQTAIEVFSITREKLIYEYHPNSALIPASNMKLLTTAVALSQFGPDYRFRTQIAADAPPQRGVIEENIYIKGFGDPFLVYEEMWKLTHYLAMSGLKTIKGDVVADDTFFDDKLWGDGWKINGDLWYEAQIGALSFNFNTIEIHVAPGEKLESQLIAWLNPNTNYVKLVNMGRTVSKIKQNIKINQSVKGEQQQIVISGDMTPTSKPRTVWRTIKDPTLYTATVFRDYLEHEGVKIKGKVRRGQVPQTAYEIYTHYSKPLALIVRGLNKMSNNFTAEQILKTLAAETNGPPGTAEKGLELVKNFLKNIGVDLYNLKLVDGSGLSRENRLTPHIINQVLMHMYHAFNLRPEYMASLAVAGVDGTLNGRLNHIDVKGRIRAKTGHIRKVAALSGYIATRHNELLAFSMLMNNFKTSVPQAQNIQDKICQELIDLNRE